ncbi:MAG: hypothetical protein KKB30_08020 [Proteobacteria bacterium]|nr:hypothetical protein [Pseudomonadota bacterium]MBU1714765.1 hypothetical protein [Pseudomonadota bacterium]
MRPSKVLFIVVLFLVFVDAGLYLHARDQQKRYASSLEAIKIATAVLGLTDLCVSTEARYTRHPAVSDPIVPFMDHPGAIEHFPSGSFWAPPQIRKSLQSSAPEL